MSIRSMIAAALALAALALTSAPAAAQERQVPLDEQGRVQVVDLRMAQRLGLWVEEHPGFREARLFETPAGEYVLEITTEVQGQVTRRRVPVGAAEVAELRRRVGAGLAAAPVLAPGGQEGRYLLLAQTTLAGVTYYGAALPRAVGAHGSGAAALYLATAAGSFFVPWLLTNDAPVTFGMANLSRYGVTRGIGHGVMLHELLRGEEPTELVCHPEWGGYCEERRIGDHERTRAAAGFAVGAAEGVAGYLWARNEGMTAGTANAIVTYGDAGTLWGLGTGHLVGAERRGTAALGLAGAAAGIMGGRAMAARRDYTWGDTDVIYTGGVLGAYSGFALAVGAGGEEVNDRTITALAMAGSAAGLFLGDHLVRETNFTVAQATLNRLGTVAGGLAGATLGVAMEEPRIAMIGSAFGAAAGYLATYAALAPEARENVGDRITRWNVELSPAGAASLARGSASGRDVPTPVLSVRYRF
jgi:hypothetical protein